MASVSPRSRTGGSPPEVVERVRSILAEVEVEGEPAVRRISRSLDGWDPPSFRVDPGDVERRARLVEPAVAAAIDLAADRIEAFARAQLATLVPLDLELGDGIRVGHRHLPVESVGAYVPGGRYPLVSSVLMSALVARTAGVARVVVATPPRDGGIHPPTAYAIRRAGADETIALGGAQALAAMAFGALPGLEPVAMIVGAGNAYVTEAKRQLFGLVGIDLLAGPTETLIVADESARPELLAVDLLSQAEHGPTSPAVLVTTSEQVGVRTRTEIERLLEEDRGVAADAWRNHGQVLVVDSPEEAAAAADAFAPEHLTLHVADADWYEARLRNYGSLFVGEHATVTFGDKVSGPNHTLPTGGAARHSGGLWVGSFLRTLTYHRVSPEGAALLAAPAAEISRAEGLAAHARAADVRRRPSAT